MNSPTNPPSDSWPQVPKYGAISDGGPAFPQNDAHVNRINNLDGMSLRDYFAGQALVGLLTLSANGRSNVRLADEAYVYADAMLAARERKSNG